MNGRGETIALSVLAVLLVSSTFIAVSPVELRVATGDSMQPTMDPQILAVCVESDPATLEEGDIISFESNAGDLMHRVVAVDTETETLIARGDNKTYSDDPVAFDAVNCEVWDWWSLT